MTNMRCVNGLPKTSLCFKTLQYKKLIWSKIKHCQKFQQKAVWTIWQNLLKSSIILQDTCYGWDIKSGGGWMGPDQSSGISRACSIMLTQRNAPSYFRKKTHLPFSDRVFWKKSIQRDQSCVFYYACINGTSLLLNAKERSLLFHKKPHLPFSDTVF